jgi:hypothetical protein
MSFSRCCLPGLYRYQVGIPRCPQKGAKFGGCEGFSENGVPGSISNLSTLRRFFCGFKINIDNDIVLRACCIASLVLPALFRRKDGRFRGTLVASAPLISLLVIIVGNSS